MDEDVEGDEDEEGCGLEVAIGVDGGVIGDGGSAEVEIPDHFSISLYNRIMGGRKSSLLYIPSYSKSINKPKSIDINNTPLS